MTDNNAVVAATSTKIIFNTLNKDARTVSARELHDRLGVETQFSIWFNRMTEYGFSAENGDYSNSIFFDRVQMEGNREVKRQIVDYNISIDMAKEICMIQRNEAGKMFRRYFIEVEKQWSQIVKSPIERILANSVDQLEAVEAIKEVLLVEKQKQALIEQQRDKAEEAKAIAEQERDSVKEAFSRSVVSDNDKLYSTFIKELKMTNPCASSLLKELKIFGKTGHLSDYGDWFKIKVSDNGFPARFVTKLGQEMLIKLFNNNRDKMKAINGTYRYIKPQDRFKEIPEIEYM